MKEDEAIEKVGRLAEEHWRYMKGFILSLASVHYSINTLEYVYKQAMIHGYKHGMEDCDDQATQGEHNCQ